MKRLQETRFDRSEYERPNQTWVCGYAAEGRACHRGPDASGGCQTTSECTPRKEGDRWRCTRVSAQGGPCVSGPSPTGVCAHPVIPCRPVRSLKARRGALSRGAAAVGLALTLLLFSDGRARQVVLDPGPLSPSHAAVARGCPACHLAATAGIRRAISPSRGEDTGRCLACHRLPDESGRRAHTAPPSALPDPDGHSRGPLLVEAGARLSPRDPLIECATCHREHTGDALTRVGEERCQTCHALRFASFSQGHPELKGYPSPSESLAFRHRSTTHRRWGCPACHLPGPDGRNMSLKPFAESCAPCHAVELAAKEDLDLSAAPFQPYLSSASCLMPREPAGAARPSAGFYGALRYRPEGHADPEMRGWLDLATREASTPTGRKLLTALTRDGRCTGCHPVERGSVTFVHWSPRNPDQGGRFTRFSHRHHRTESCESCHPAASGGGDDQPDFVPLPKARCATCHGAGKAGSGCLECHLYHPRPFNTAGPRAEPTMVGVTLCGTCHANALKAWVSSVHGRERRAAEDVALYPEELRDRCRSCHRLADGSESGARCESCHGAGSEWVSLHADRSASDRLARAEEAGLVDPNRVYELASRCLGCHVIRDEALVTAGHPPGSDFELASWSQGEVRHGFLDPCGGELKTNRPASAERLRALYLAGRLADLEASLDALARSQGDRYMKQMRHRVTNASAEIDRLASQAPPLTPELAPLVSRLSRLDLDKVHSAKDLDREALLAVAAAARETGLRVGGRPTTDLATLDALLTDKPKGAPLSP